MNWPDAFAMLFALIGLSFIFHGFPDIKIGGTHTTHYHNNENENEEQ